jgi:hypothetical protein
MIRIQVQNHDIAITVRDQVIHAFLIRFEQNLEILPEDRGKKRVQRAIFRVQSDPDHE